ncbi:uncharacterized protein LDX57_009015 [Aspergillus melleus]|uniref:uncharacterized protein n=1 Tax=Aspergillus melleus TaxID=138277 RepID=UPI001E8EBBDE|nr:uncharacterized protein LDX57_009015 [Aspergillus melleus]KAH8431357.1 hypothetical protein LDX57_009015 [Aspergillus melleus]
MENIVCMQLASFCLLGEGGGLLTFTLRVSHPDHNLYIESRLMDTADTSDELKRYLAESYCHETRLSTGEIYLHLRQAQINNDQLSEKRWRARLTPCETERLKMLKANPALYNAFDALIDLPAIVASGAILTVWNKLIALRCREELIYYLESIYHFWASLVGNDRTRPSAETRRKMRMIDTRTVTKLEGFAPGVSQADKRYVEGVVLGGDVFRNFSRAERSAISRKLVSYAGRIPSLRLFFEDTKFFAIAARRVKRLTDDSPGQLTWAEDGDVPSIKERMDFMFHAPNDGNITIQTSENESRSARSGDAAFQIAYRQVWLCALRSSGGNPGEGKRPAVLREWAHPHVQYCLARLASGLGFRSDRIEKIVSRPVQPENPPWDDFEDGKEPAVKRHGIPYVATFKYDRRVLFLDHVHAGPRECGELTSSFVLRDIYHSFFGDLDEGELHAQPSHEADAPDSDVEVASAPPFTRHHTPEPAESPHTSRDGQGADGIDSSEPTTEPPSTSSATARDQGGIGRDSSDAPGSPTDPTSTSEASTYSANIQHEEDDNDFPNPPTPTHREHNTNPPTTPSARSTRQSTSVPEPTPPGQSAKHGPASEWIARLEEAKTGLQAIQDDVADKVRDLEEEERDTADMGKALQEIVRPKSSDILLWDSSMQKRMENKRDSAQEKVDARVQRLSQVRSTFNAAIHEVKGQLEKIESFLKHLPSSTPEPERIGPVLGDAERGRVAASALGQKGLSEMNTLRSEGVSLWPTIFDTQTSLLIMCIGGLINGSLSLQGKVKDLRRSDSFLSSDFGSPDPEAMEMHQKRQRSLSEIFQGLDECLVRMRELEKFSHTDDLISTFGAGREGVLAWNRWLKNLRNESQSQVDGYWKSAVDIAGEVKRGYSNAGRALQAVLLAESRSWESLSSTHDFLRSVLISLQGTVEADKDAFGKYLDENAKDQLTRLLEKISRCEEERSQISTTVHNFKVAENELSEQISQVEGSSDGQILIAIGQKWINQKKDLASQAAERKEKEAALDANRVHTEQILCMMASIVSSKAQEASTQVKFEEAPENIKEPQKVFEPAAAATITSGNCARLARSAAELAKATKLSEDVYKRLDALACEAEAAAHKAEEIVRGRMEEYLGHSFERIRKKVERLGKFDKHYRASSIEKQRDLAANAMAAVRGATFKIFEGSRRIQSLQDAENANQFLNGSINAISELQGSVAAATGKVCRLYGLIARHLAAAILEKGTGIEGQEELAAAAVRAGNRGDLESCMGEAEQGMKDLDGFIELLDHLHIIATAQRREIPGYVSANPAGNEAKETIEEIAAHNLRAKGDRDKAKMTVDRMRQLRMTNMGPEREGDRTGLDAERAESETDRPGDHPAGVQTDSTERDSITQQELIARAHKLVTEVQKQKSLYTEAKEQLDGPKYDVKPTIDTITSLVSDASAVGRALVAQRPAGMDRAPDELENAIDACFQVVVDSNELLGLVVEDTCQHSEAACKRLDEKRALNQAAAKAGNKETWRTCVEYAREVAGTLSSAIEGAETARSAAGIMVVDLAQQTWHQTRGVKLGRLLKEMDRWLRKSKENLHEASKMKKEMEITWWREAADKKAKQTSASFEKADRAFKILTEDARFSNEYSLAKTAHKLATRAYREATEYQQSIGEETKESYTTIIEKFDMAHQKALSSQRSAEAVLEAQSKGNKRTADGELAQRSTRRHAKHVKVFKIREKDWPVEDHVIAPGAAFDKAVELRRRGDLYSLIGEKERLGFLNAEEFETLVVRGERIFFLQESNSTHGLDTATQWDRARNYRFLYGE